MKRIAIFTEGQTDLIFVRRFLQTVIDPSKLSLECFELVSHNLLSVPYRYPNDYATVHFMVVNTQGDEGVLTSIREREQNLIAKGYDRIIALRDMYSKSYVRLSPSAINDDISAAIIQAHDSTIQTMQHRDRIRLFFAIMEIEAWFLAMHNLFPKIDALLTVDHIRATLDIDLESVDPQKAFFRPSHELRRILRLCGRDYRKKRGDAEHLVANMESSDYADAINANRCSCFAAFYSEILSWA